MEGTKNVYMNEKVFEQDIRGFLFYQETGEDNTEKYKVIFEYSPAVLNKLREGDIIAVESYSTIGKNEKIYSLLEVVKILPTHITIERLKNFKFMGAAREFVKEATKDFENDPKIIRDHIYVEAEAVQTGYSLIVNESSEGISFKMEPNKPILGRDVGLLKAPEMIEKLINHNIKGVPLGNLYATYEEKKKVKVMVNPSKLITHHYSVFGFTGHGKSNLNATIVSKLLTQENLKIIIFDITDEYTNLLIDAIENNGYVIIDENDVFESLKEYYENPTDEEKLEKAAEELAKYSKKPGIFDNTMFISVFKNVYKNLLLKKKIKIFSPELFVTGFRILTIGDFFIELEKRIGDDKTCKLYIENMKDMLPEVLRDKNIKVSSYESLELSKIKEFERFIDELVEKTGAKKSDKFKGCINAIKSKMHQEITKNLPEYYVDLKWIIENFITNSTNNSNKLCILVSSDKETLINIIIEVLETSLRERKRGTKRHDVLFLIDEGHEFVRGDTGSTTEEKQCSRTIERLTRMGRKYGLGICISSQRVAYLNRTAISNCHTTFIGAIPRKYDRNELKEAYGISDDLLSQIVTFPPGHWYVVSSGATGMNNVPIRFVAENREKRLAEFFREKNLLSPEAETFLKKKKLIKSE